VAGAGTAFAFIPISIAGLSGVAARDAGLASGLLNTAQQLGGAIGVAVASTVAASHAKALAEAGRLPSAALTGGFQWAFWVCTAIAAVGVPVALVVPRRMQQPEPVMLSAAPQSHDTETALTWRTS
jgi:MFS family permease